MFYKVQILDANGKLKKLFTSEMLSKRHWELFPDNIKKAEKEKNIKQKKNRFNTFKKESLGVTARQKSIKKSMVFIHKNVAKIIREENKL